MFNQFTVTVYLALIAAASPLVVRKSPITIPLARRFNVTGSSKILELDQARAKFLKSGKRTVHTNKATSDATVPVPVTNGAVTYTATVCPGARIPVLRL
jgi:hypothetical protein